MKKILLFICLLTTGSILATNFFVRTNADATSWSNITFNTNNVLVTLAEGDMLPVNIARDSVFYLAPGTYKTLSTTVGNSPTAASTNAKIYGGFSGTESSIDLSARITSDKDGNGIVEPWEFTHEAIITTSNDAHKFSAAGTGTGSRLLVVTGTGAEVNGVTITDFNYLTYSGALSIGMASGTPTAANNVLGKEGVLRLCTVKKIKSAIGIVMSTNKFSVIDQCLIESNVVTNGNWGGAVFLNLCGGKVSGCVIRNNASSNASGRSAGVHATSLASTDMDAIVENCVIYNNYAGGNGAAIRGEAQANKRGIQIVNCTMANNQTTGSGSTSAGSVELINSGTIVNSVIVGDLSAELRPNTTNNYILNTVYGEYASGAAALYGANNVSGKLVADIKFQNPTISVGVAIPDFTTPWDAAAIAKYNEIRQANFKIDPTNASISPLITNSGIKSMPASYLIGGTGASVSLTAAIPATDILGNTRPLNTTGNLDLGAYQYSSVPTDVTSAISKNVYCKSVANNVVIAGAEGLNVKVYSVSGQMLKSVNVNSANHSIEMPKGIYLIKSDIFVEKVVVR